MEEIVLLRTGDAKSGGLCGWPIDTDALQLSLECLDIMLLVCFLEIQATIIGSRRPS